MSKNSPLTATRIPIVATLRTYRASDLGSDVSAGVAIAAVGLPSAIAYPAIAGLPPETGLYASIFAVVGYGLFGPSPRLITGPDAATMIMLGAVVAAAPGTTPGDKVVLASAIALLVGAFCLLARLFRLDMVASFLSRPILTGFMTGISLSILIGQIGRFTGLKIEADGLVRPILELLGKLPLVHVPSFILATAMLLLLLAVRRSKLPVPGPVIVVVLSVVLSWAFDFAGMGIKVVGAIPDALPRLSIAWPQAVGIDDLVVNALAVWLVSFSAGIVSARAFGAKAGYRVDAGQELQGFAAANIASGLFGGFPVTSSDSRTAINLSVGGKTRLAGLISAVVLVVILIYLNDLLRLLPVPALGAILVAAALSLMDFDGLRSLWRVSRSEFFFALIGLVAPIVLGVLNGVIIAIGATLTYLIFQSMSPRIVLLGRIPGESGFHKLHREVTAVAVPGLAVCLLQGSMLFFNADAVRSQIEALAADLPADTRWLILDAGAISQIDTTAAATLIEITKALDERGIRFGMADLHNQCRQLLTAAGATELIGQDMIFDNVEDMYSAFKANSGSPRAR